MSHITVLSAREPFDFIIIAIREHQLYLSLNIFRFV